jgi:hypothetical protein
MSSTLRIVDRHALAAEPDKFRPDAEFDLARARGAPARPAGRSICPPNFAPCAPRSAGRTFMPGEPMK